ncbi:MAG TPA: DegV family protein [Halanaerobiales bacterium]|nr:DegV family protein [Halanaerobiales bacterium]
MKIKFILDSAADMPEELTDKYDIDVFPLYIHHGDKQYKDGIGITSKKVYENMKNGEVYKTSQVAVNDFMEKFEEYAKKDKTVIYPAFSSELSGTFQSAVLAKNKIKEKYPDFDITIIDTKSASMGVGLALYNVLQEMEKNNLNKKEIIEKIKYYAEHMEHIFTVEDLDYLVRGGRLNKISGLVGGILNIKPIIEVENGKLEQLEKKKGSKKVRKRIIELFLEKGTNIAEQNLAILHANSKKKAEEFKSEIEEKTKYKSVIFSDIGAVIGAHTGPGTYGIIFLNEKRKVNEVEIYK